MLWTVVGIAVLSVLVGVVQVAASRLGAGAYAARGWTRTGLVARGGVCGVAWVCVGLLVWLGWLLAWRSMWLGAVYGVVVGLGVLPTLIVVPGVLGIAPGWLEPIRLRVLWPPMSHRLRVVAAVVLLGFVCVLFAGPLVWLALGLLADGTGVSLTELVWPLSPLACAPLTVLVSGVAGRLARDIVVEYHPDLQSIRAELYEELDDVSEAAREVRVEELQELQASGAFEGLSEEEMRALRRAAQGEDVQFDDR